MHVKKTLEPIERQYLQSTLNSAIYVVPFLDRLGGGGFFFFCPTFENLSLRPCNSKTVPGADLLGDVDALLPGLQLRHQLSHVLTRSRKKYFRVQSFDFDIPISDFAFSESDLRSL